jgi:radical SAM superfamily enzyme YgiQ (UPF0313 family)
MKILLVVYDNDSYIHWFPQGIAYVAAVLLKAGHEVEIYNQDVHHYPESHLQNYLDRNFFDVVGLGFIGGYYQYRKALKISAAINASKKKPFYIIGGHGPTPDPEFFLRKTGADAIVMGEGEITIVKLLEALSNGEPFEGIQGIAFQEEGRCIVNERRPLIQDIDTIPFPAYELFPVSYYRLFRVPYSTNADFVMPILSGRGCPFKCNFCYRMDEGFRPRSNESIIEEIEMLKSNYGITHISFGDELLMSSRERTISICNDFIKHKLNVKWDCNGRLNFAQKDVLQLMRKAGCVFINYGIESFDDAMLKVMNKALNTRQIVKGIEATLEAGISPGYNIIFGNIGETEEVLNKGVDFLLKYDDASQMRTIRPVTPYPGSPLYYYAIEKGLLKDCEDFYENKHLNSDLVSVNFTKLDESDFHRCLLDANTRLITNYFEKKLRAVIEQAENLYIDQDTGFRGFRQS